MPRQPRIEAPGLIYHVIARGIERRTIFADKKDYNFFLKRFGEILNGSDTECFAFCLLPNHFHLLLRSGNVYLSSIMRRLLTSYALFFNQKNQRSGHLFQNRYKSIICQEDPYLLELVRYIHLNPIRANLIKSMNELNSYSYSGHSALLERAHFDWYQQDKILGYFGRNHKTAIRKYIAFIADGLSMGRNPAYSSYGRESNISFSNKGSSEKSIADSRILGDETFILFLQAHKKRGTGNDNKGYIEELLAKIAAAYSLQPGQIKGKTRSGKTNEAKAVFAYLSNTSLGLSFAEIARCLSVHRSTAARMVEQGRVIGASSKLDNLLT